MLPYDTRKAIRFFWARMNDASGKEMLKFEDYGWYLRFTKRNIYLAGIIAFFAMVWQYEPNLRWHIEHFFLYIAIYVAVAWIWQQISFRRRLRKKPQREIWKLTSGGPKR
jgi:hypothetical protein